jgi:hypothetical protein
MARGTRKTVWSRSFNSVLKTMTRVAIRTGTKAIKESIRATPLAGKRKASQKSDRTSGQLDHGDRHRCGGASSLSALQAVRPAAQRALAIAGHAARLRAGCRSTGCQQPDESVAARERFFVLYPEQDRLSSLQGCWNWYDTRTGRAQAEANSISAAIEQVCLLQAVDRGRVALAGISAGAGMAVLLATLPSATLSGHRHAFGDRAGCRAFVGECHQGHVRAKRTTSPLPAIAPM